MQFDPVALINSAPATALCVLVYLELRVQRATQKTISETLVAIQTALELVAQTVGFKLNRRKPTPVPPED